jgi:hypothetical protein
LTLVEVRGLLARPEVATLPGVGGKDEFLRLITGFANLGGGRIFIGPDPETLELRGVNHPGVALEHVRFWLPSPTMARSSAVASRSVTPGVIPEHWPGPAN